MTKGTPAAMRRDNKPVELNKAGLDQLREECKKLNVPEAELDRMIEQLKDYKPPVRGEVVRCSKCGRKVLIEQILVGIDHTSETMAVCWDCLDDQAKERAKELYHIKTE